MAGYKIVILGAGNVGYQFAWHLHNSGHQIVQIFSRHLPSAKWIGNLIEIPCTDKYDEITQDGEIYLLTVKDDAIPEVCSQLRLQHQVIAHTSGSVSMKVLEGVSENFGIFYPLQTLSRNVSVDFGVIPFCVNASNEKSFLMLNDLAGTLTNKIIRVDDEKRLAIHVAAVFANNFTNHLFSISQVLLERNGLSFEIFKPLINETVRKIQNHDPLNVQTGPASRNDEQTIEKHLQFLKDDPGFAELYRLFTEDIQRLQREITG
jgi:predicted short-subunit dehydrogenase-like oxidoreductase (DUF2520 family)